MSPNRQLQAFEERFYKWAERDFRREIEQGFPFLSRVKNRISGRVIRVMKALTKEEQFSLVSTLIKNKSVIPFAFWETDFGLENQKTLSWYHKKIEVPTAEELERTQRLFDGEISYQINRPAILDAVRQKLTDVFPNQVPKKVDGDLHYTTKIHGFDLDTLIEKGGSIWQLSYQHQIQNIWTDFHVKEISLFSWLGIATKVYWFHLTKDDVEETAELVRDLVAHFLPVAEKLLRDLPPPLE